MIVSSLRMIANDDATPGFCGSAIPMIVRETGISVSLSERVRIFIIFAALLRRTGTLNDKNILDFNGLTINKLSHEVKLNGEELLLSPKEYDLLIYLSSNEGIALSRDRILDNVWGYDYFGDIRTVDTNIKRLREKLLDKANYIATVRGSGYKFEVK